MAIDENGVYIPDSFETIRDEIQSKQNVMGTKMEIFDTSEYQSMSNPIITGIYNIQSVVASLPAGVSNELSMQGVYIERSGVNTTDAITNEAKKSEFIDYTEIYNTSTPKEARIELYIWKDDIEFESVDLQYTANEIAKITPVFVPYFEDIKETVLSKIYTCPVSQSSNIEVIFNVAEAVSIDVDITTNPQLGDESIQLKADFTELFNTTQTIGMSFDEAFYQRTLFIDGLSSMNYTATITVCLINQILRLGIVTVNGV